MLALVYLLLMGGSVWELPTQPQNFRSQKGVIIASGLEPALQISGPTPHPVVHPRRTVRQSIRGMQPQYLSSPGPTWTRPPGCAHGLELEGHDRRGWPAKIRPGPEWPKIVHQNRGAFGFKFWNLICHCAGQPLAALRGCKFAYEPAGAGTPVMLALQRAQSHAEGQVNLKMPA